MCLAIKIMEQKAVAREFLSNVDNVMTNFNISLDNACQGLGHTVEEYNKAKELLENAKKCRKCNCIK